jgi:hypothetical protein
LAKTAYDSYRILLPDRRGSRILSKSTTLLPREGATEPSDVHVRSPPGTGFEILYSTQPKRDPGFRTASCNSVYHLDYAGTPGLGRAGLVGDQDSRFQKGGSIPPNGLEGISKPLASSG